MKKLWNGKALLVFAICLISAQIALAQQAQTVAPRITEAVDETKLVTLTGNTHRMAQAQFDQGPAPDSLPLERLMLILKRSPQQEAALRTLLDEQQDRNSPNFHKWLTPEQFGQQFGPADADIQVVTIMVGIARLPRDERCEGQDDDRVQRQRGTRAPGFPHRYP